MQVQFDAMTVLGLELAIPVREQVSIAAETRSEQVQRFTLSLSRSLPLYVYIYMFLHAFVMCILFRTFYSLTGKGVAETDQGQSLHARNSRPQNVNPKSYAQLTP